MLHWPAVAKLSRISRTRNFHFTKSHYWIRGLFATNKLLFHLTVTPVCLLGPRHVDEAIFKAETVGGT